MIRIVRYTQEKFSLWNDFVETSNNGTIFHRLDFLDYHGTKFKDNEHHLMFYKGERLIAVLPMAIFDEPDGRIARSPYGASWGGLVFSDRLSIKYVMQISELLLNYLKERQVVKCIITVTPQCYFAKYTNYFEFSLFSLGFSIINRENHLVVELPQKKEDIMQVFDSKCRNQTRNGLRNFNQIKQLTSNNEYYQILLEDKIRHNSSPTHTEADLSYLSTILPDRITFDIAATENNYKAGICYFVGNKNCILTFYMSQENKALGLNGTNALIYVGMERAVEKGFKYYDFGGSSLNSKIRNIGVSEFKESFGAVGVFRDTYKKTL